MRLDAPRSRMDTATMSTKPGPNESDIPVKETSIEDAPFVPFTDEERRVIERAREELARTGRTYTTEEIRNLLREKQQRTG
jgi:hypothetical protein